MEYELHHFFWTDSKIVLGFVNSEARRFHVYVSNRVQMIRNVSEPSQWYYVATESNPADIASRGATGDQLSSTTWFTGPDFLWDSNFRPEPELRDLDNMNPEVTRMTLATSWTEVKLCFHLSSQTGIVQKAF